MLTLVEIVNPRSDTLQLYLLDSSSGYAVKEIAGLDPVAAAITTSTLAQVDGAQPQNARRDVRNITLKLGLEPDYISTTVDSLRSNLYTYLMPKTLVGLNFYKDGTLFAKTQGQVEIFQNAMFSADPEVDVTIVCYDPDLSAPAPVTVSLLTTDTTTTTEIDYAGTSPAGIIFTLNVSRDIDGFTLYNTAPDNTVQTFAVEGTGAFTAGDVVTVTTVPGSKSVILTRSSIDSSVLYYLQENAFWITLLQGTNRFRAYAAGLIGDSGRIPCTVTYTPLYGAL